MGRRKKVLGVGVRKTGMDFIEFKTEAKAKKFLQQVRSIKSKYSTRGYLRKGKRVYRY